ncbi:hypothetical protein [Streptomyces sp. NPDC005969]|uniref:hypothetical protein n=1 Tax=Streptomyces sp. NPDC005969 TaxID=3156722 RepID=UPI0033D1A354
MAGPTFSDDGGGRDLRPFVDDICARRRGRSRAAVLAQLVLRRPALGLLFTKWHFDGALLWSGLITMAAIVYLLLTMRAHKLTPARLAIAAGFYLVFAIGLVLILA